MVVGAVVAHRTPRYNLLPEVGVADLPQPVVEVAWLLAVDLPQPVVEVG